MTIDIKSEHQHIADFRSHLSASTTRGALGPSVTDPESEADTLRNTDTADMVKQVTRRIESLQGRLGETRGFDPKTGAPAYVLTADDPRRKAMEVELYNLRSSVLPYTQAQAAQIDAKKARLITTEQRLQAEFERQQRLATAATKRAEELEVEAMAQRILLQRRRTGSA